MKTAAITRALVLVGMLSGTVAACAGQSHSGTAGQFVDDSVTSNQVRAAIIGDEQISIFDIDVTTQEGVVQLSGFVDEQAHKTRAGQVASNVEGVRSVENNITVQRR